MIGIPPGTIPGLGGPIRMPALAPLGPGKILKVLTIDGGLSTLEWADDGGFDSTADQQITGNWNFATDLILEGDAKISGDIDMGLYGFINTTWATFKATANNVSLQGTDNGIPATFNVDTVDAVTLEANTLEASVEVETPKVSALGDLTIKTGGTDRWKIDTNGDFLPILTNTYDIGTRDLSAGNVFTQRIEIGGYANAAQNFIPRIDSGKVVFSRGDTETAHLAFSNSPTSHVGVVLGGFQAGPVSGAQFGTWMGRSGAYWVTQNAALDGGTVGLKYGDEAGAMKLVTDDAVTLGKLKLGELESDQLSTDRLYLSGDYAGVGHNQGVGNTGRLDLYAHPDTDHPMASVGNFKVVSHSFQLSPNYGSTTNGPIMKYKDSSTVSFTESDGTTLADTRTSAVRGLDNLNLGFEWSFNNQIYNTLQLNTTGATFVQLAGVNSLKISPGEANTRTKFNSTVPYHHAINGVTYTVQDTSGFRPNVTGLDLGLDNLRWDSIYGNELHTPIVRGDGGFVIDDDGNSRWVFSPGVFSANGIIRPASDNSRDLGVASLRWRQIHGVDIRGSKLYAGSGNHYLADISGGLTLSPNGQSAWMVNGYGNVGTAVAATSPGGSIGWSTSSTGMSLGTHLESPSDGTVDVLKADGSLGTSRASTFTTNSSFTGSEYFGEGASVTGNQSTAIGFSAISGVNGTSVGWDSTTTSGVAIGRSASTVVGVSIGVSASGASSEGVVVGASSTRGIQGNTIGAYGASGTYSNSLGTYADSSFQDSIALGQRATTTKTNQMVIGAQTHKINEIFLDTPDDFTFKTEGGNLNLDSPIAVYLRSGGSLKFASDAAQNITYQHLVPGTNGVYDLGQEIGPLYFRDGKFTGEVKSGTLSVQGTLKWDGSNKQRLMAGDWESYESSLTAWQTGFRQEASSSGIKWGISVAPTVTESWSSSTGTVNELATLLSNKGLINLIA